MAGDDFIRWMQGRLILHGFSCGPAGADGFMGVKTRAALANFNRSKGLGASAGATAATIAALRVSRDGSSVKPTHVDVRPVWLAELERRKGLQEVRDYSILSKWLKSDGRTLGDPRQLPWCGDAIQTAIALTLPDEPQVANPYLARGWLKFGTSTSPRLGAVMVFWRGSRAGADGHVALYLGEDAASYQVLGGNQANAIGVCRIAKDRLLGARWPTTDTLQTAAIRSALDAPLSTNEA